VVGLLALSSQLLAQSDNIVLTVALEDWRSDMLSQRVLQDFYETHPNVKVVTVPLSADNLYYLYDFSDTESSLDKAKAVFSSADIVAASGDSNLGMLATRAGYVLDLSPYVRADNSGDLDDFYTPALKAFEWDNGVWGLPVGLHTTVMAYDPAAFDAANYPYPDSSWTLDQYIDAGLALTVRDANGDVTLPGLSGLDERILLRAFYGHGGYDTSVQPEMPTLTDPDLVSMLKQMDDYRHEMLGDQPFPQNVDWNKVPIQMGNLQLFSQPQTKRYRPVLFPGDTGYVSAEGFAVSAGTPYPDMAYELAKYLTGKIDVATRFYAELPARRSLDGQSTGDAPAGEITYMPLEIPDALKPVLPQLVETGFSNAELRYLQYLFFARGKMQQDQSLSVENALQLAQEKAIDDLALAEQRETADIVISRPVPTPVPEADQITLTFGLLSNPSPLPNPQDWERVAQDFAASDPEVGSIDLAAGASITADGPEIDCAYTFYNAVPLMDLSLIQPLDPFLATDSSFDRHDVPEAMWPQVTINDQIYGLPMTIIPMLMWYNPASFEAAGLSMPESGWTINEFIDALTQLKAVQSTAPYRSQRSGSTIYVMMADALGGMSIDYSTAVPTYYLTDPAVVEALRQALNLAKDGLIDYVRLDPASNDILVSGSDGLALYDASLYTWDLVGTAGSPSLPISFPQGTDLTPVAYSLGAAYISAQTPYPDACYHWLSTIAQHPELFQDMPARQSQAASDAVIAAQGQHAANLYVELFDLLDNPQTAVIPINPGTSGFSQDMPETIWFNQALDAYVLDDRDLETSLANAQTKIDEYRLCTGNIPALDLLTSDANKREQYNQRFKDCAVSVDPALRDRLNT